MTSALHITAPRVLRSEWSKFFSLRSTWIALAAATVLVLAMGAITGISYDPGGEDAGRVDPVRFTLLGTQFSQIVIAVLGILVTAGEYSTGMIRSSLAAVPRRTPVLWAKAAVFTAVAFAATLATAFAAFPLAQAFLDGTDMSLSIGDPGVVRTLTGTAVALALTGAFTLALGALLRSVPGAIGAYIGCVLILPQVLGMLPFDAVKDAVKYLPLEAADALSTLHRAEGALAPGTALLVLGAWVTAALVAAALLLRRRDV